MDDAHVIKELRIIFKRFLSEQEQSPPTRPIQEVPGEIHGYIADLLFRDHAKNELLLSFLTHILYHPARSDKELVALLNTIDEWLQSTNISLLKNGLGFGDKQFITVQGTCDYNAANELLGAEVADFLHDCKEQKLLVDEGSLGKKRTIVYDADADVLYLYQASGKSKRRESKSILVQFSGEGRLEAANILEPIIGNDGKAT